MKVIRTIVIFISIIILSTYSFGLAFCFRLKAISTRCWMEFIFGKRIFDANNLAVIVIFLLLLLLLHINTWITIFFFQLQLNSYACEFVVWLFFRSLIKWLRFIKWIKHFQFHIAFSVLCSHHMHSRANERMKLFHCYTKMLPCTITSTCTLISKLLLKLKQLSLNISFYIWWTIYAWRVDCFRRMFFMIYNI